MQAGNQDNAGFITIARVLRSQGRRGEVAAALLTDFPERFAVRKRLFVVDPHGQRRRLELENHWFHKGHVVLKFAGVDSISAAELLAGSEVQVPREERAELQAGAVYISDLIGCSLYDRGREVGRIENVQFGAGEAPLLVVKGRKEFLVPWAEEYVERLDLHGRRMEMKLPPGLLDVDAPLTEDEKRMQQKKD